MGKKNKKEQTVKRTRDEEPAADPVVEGDDDLDADDDGMVFEDPYEDEIESESGDDVAANAAAADDDDADGDAEMILDGDNIQDDDDSDDNAPKQVFRPGIDTLAEGEVLDYDSSAYLMYHALNSEWPCMTFDIIRDPLGQNRTKFPHTMYLVAGTQADTPQNNSIMCLKLTDLHKTRHDDSENDDDDSDDGVDDDPIVESRNVRHHGGINRLRTMPQNQNIVATWADTGKVHISDITAHLSSLDKAPEKKLNPQFQPLFTFSGHQSEGFAMDWSPSVEGRLATGDCAGGLHVWDRASAGSWTVSPQPFVGHTQSVEDIQWSPIEQQVFASCSVDGTIRVWDARNKNGAAVSIKAHDSDVNVISWNPTVQYLLVSGCDDGSFRIWDLRTFTSGNVEPAAHFMWHRAPITSVEWHPSDGSVVVVSGADDQITVWDMSLEREDDVPDVEGVPPQLLFVHQGQQQIKEVHWHRQIPGALVSTALSGFNVFQPENLSSSA